MKEIQNYIFSIKFALLFDFSKFLVKNIFLLDNLSQYFAFANTFHYYKCFKLITLILLFPFVENIFRINVLNKTFQLIKYVKFS